MSGGKGSKYQLVSEAMSNVLGGSIDENSDRCTQIILDTFTCVYFAQYRYDLFRGVFFSSSVFPVISAEKTLIGNGRVFGGQIKFDRYKYI